MLIKITLYFIIHILKVEVRETKTINDIKFCVNGIEKGGKFYLGNSTYKELTDPLYKLIQNCYTPDLVIDIGANYGFMSLVFAKHFNARIIAIEPDERLCKYIRHNATLNGCHIHCIRAICDTYPNIHKFFAVNPVNSQDNRVLSPSKNWKLRPIITTSIDYILKRQPFVKFVFIKTDTQGYEYMVLLGAETFLRNNSNWIMKMEFAPSLLKQQGTDPAYFLEYLIRNYDVVDLQGVNYNETDILNLFRNKITVVKYFIDYVITRGPSGTGWIDLLIKSKKL